MVSLQEFFGTREKSGELVELLERHRFSQVQVPSEGCRNDPLKHIALLSRLQLGVVVYKFEGVAIIPQSSLRWGDEVGNYTGGFMLELDEGVSLEELPDDHPLFQLVATLDRPGVYHPVKGQPPQYDLNAFLKPTG